MKKLAIILSLILIPSPAVSEIKQNAKSKKCEIVDCGWQVKYCGENVSCRDFSCENDCTDNLIVTYRKEYNYEKGEQYCNGEWCGLKPYLQDHAYKCICPEIWEKCSYEEYILKRKKEGKSNKSICNMYDENNK